MCMCVYAASISIAAAACAAGHLLQLLLQDCHVHITAHILMPSFYINDCVVCLSCSTKGLSAEELLVYQVIKQAGNTGEPAE